MEIKKNKFKRKRIVKVAFCKKECYKDIVVFFLKYN
jgi:hypothetical protein